MTDERFPGYRSGSERPSLDRISFDAEEEQRARLETQRELIIKNIGGPTLNLMTEHAIDLAYPTEIPSRMPFTKPRIVAGWVVRSYMSDAGSCTGSYTDQSPCEQNWAITEDGRYGQVKRVSRGIPALAFFNRPKLWNTAVAKYQIPYLLEIQDVAHEYLRKAGVAVPGMPQAAV